LFSFSFPSNIINLMFLQITSLLSKHFSNSVSCASSGC
jgi:hypothetical protein